MTSLDKLMEEVRDVSRLFRDSNNKDAREYYNEYIETILIDEAGKQHQDFLFKYWEDCKNEKTRNGSYNRTTL